MPDLALPVESVMPNGVSLYTIDSGIKDVVRFDMLFSGGYSVQQKPLQALFTNRMLREGAWGLSSAEISRRLDNSGAWIDLYSSHNCNHITLYTLTKHFEKLLDLLEAMIKHPQFPAKNLETVRRNNKSYYMINSRKVDVVAQRHFENCLWGGGHPLGHIVCAEDYDAITRELLMDFHSKIYNSRNCTLFISGKIDATAINAISKRFGNDTWGSDTILPSIKIDDNNSAIGRRKVDIDGTLQSAVKIGCMTMNTSHPDFLKMRFLTVLFGGYFGSRLMSNIREEHGYTYHIQAELDAYGDKNAFMITSETTNEYVEPLVNEVYKEMQRLCDEKISSQELELVCNYTLGELCREYEGALVKSDVFINAWLSGQSFDAVNEYIDTVRTVTADDLSRIATEYLNRDKMFEIVVGA